VISFEPSAREYQRLCDAVQLNGAAAVTPIQRAVGAEAGHLDLRVAAAPYSGLNTLGHRFPYDGVDVSSVERVDVETLDERVRRQGLSKVDLIKIDVEGAEAAVLAGATTILQQLRPRLIIEVFSRSLVLNGASTADVEQRLRHADYRCFAIDDETAELVPLDGLTGVDEQNIVAVPAERP
jgi:FkbM family methyltransferase